MAFKSIFTGDQVQNTIACFRELAGFSVNGGNDTGQISAEDFIKKFIHLLTQAIKKMSEDTTNGGSEKIAELREALKIPALTGVNIIAALNEKYKADDDPATLNGNYVFKKFVKCEGGAGTSK